MVYHSMQPTHDDRPVRLLKRSAKVLLANSTAILFGLALASNTFAQGSLSGSESSQAKNLLNKNAAAAYLQSEYYQHLMNNEDIYGRLPPEMRRIFARIRFIALSINDASASDQVLNALTRAYLIYGMEAAAVNEAKKIILPQWKARTLIDISDFHGIQGDDEKRDQLLIEALYILNNNVEESVTSARQYYFDISSRYALAGNHDQSLAIINKTFENPINRIIGYLQITERMTLGEATNALITTRKEDLLSNIKRCEPEEVFILPGQTEKTVFSLNLQEDKHAVNDPSRLYVQESFRAFTTITQDSGTNNARKLQARDLNILLNLNTQLFKYGMNSEAHEVLNIIVQQFLYAPSQPNRAGDLIIANAEFSTNGGDDSAQNLRDQNVLRNELIKAYIRMDRIRSGMDLTSGIHDPLQLSMAYISAGNAHNEVENRNAATALFNYAQDIAILIKDSDLRDRVLLEVVRGQSLARMYGSAFQNIGEMRSLEYRSEAMYGVAQEMIFNNDLASAVSIAKYVQPHDLRIQILANLAYIRSLNPDRYYVGKLAMPPVQEMFEQIYTLMKTRLVGGESISTDSEPRAVLMAMCANAQRQDLHDRTQRGNPIDSTKRVEYHKNIVESATKYTADIKDIVTRANSFGNIAQMMLEVNEYKEAQLYLDTAWNLAWSIRGRRPRETDKIFLRIVRNKIISAQIIDAYNIATGMGGDLSPEQEIIQEETTGNTFYSERIQALMDFSRAAMSSGEYSVALRAIEDIGISTAKSVAMTNAIRDLIEVETHFNIDKSLKNAS
ncbi:MAG: hypothetical protein HRT36_06435 [Alphaproteobacteria bacterium]|nr:hypothetical protein [Alphaproteobacteria bacterium]